MARRLWWAAVLTVALATTPPMVMANSVTGRWYAAQYNFTSLSNGIRGYIRGSVTVLVDPSRQSTNEWMALTRNCCYEWVQIGQYQGGTNPYIQSPSAIHLYAESQPCNGDISTYEIADLGARPSANYNVMVQYAGIGSDDICSVHQYDFAFRLGPLTNPPQPPVYYGFMSSPLGGDDTELEALDFSHNLRQVIGRTWFGDDSVNHQPSTTYALYSYRQATNSWVLWEDSNFTGTQCSAADPPLAHVTQQRWYAFYGDDGVTQTC